MRIAGQKVEGPNTETIVIPRGDRDPIVFIAKAVLDWDEFDRLCPVPKAPIIMRKGGEKFANLEDPAYKERASTYGEKRLIWLCLKSLEGTPDLEWETIDMGKPDTYLNFDKELKEAGFSQVEIGRIRNGVFVANCLDEEKLEEARASFLASRLQVYDPSSSLKDGPSDTPFGEPVNDSA